MGRRGFILNGSISLGAIGLGFLARSWTAAAAAADADLAVAQSRLTPAQRRVLLGHRDEPAHSSPLETEARVGTYGCAGCGQSLFASAAKFDSAAGWPSFWAPLDGAVATTTDESFFLTRTEVHCRRCGGHLGQVFEDGPPPTGLRYRINGLALAFRPTGTLDS